MAYVYVFVGSNGLRKIGISKNVRSRLAQIQTASPFKVTLELAEECADAEAIEGRAHRALAEKRAFGEWFEVTAKEARDAIERAMGQDRKLQTILNDRSDRIVDPAAPRDPNYVYSLDGKSRYRILRFDDIRL